MANKILVKTDTTPIVFADSNNYTGAGGARTTQIDLRDSQNGTARQSDKEDMDTGGTANRFPKHFTVTVRIQWDVGDEPGVGNPVSFYWAPSVSAVAGTANPGGVVGADGAYTGSAGSTLDESLDQLQFLGDLLCTDDADGSGYVHQTTFRTMLPTQYGTLVVVNNSGDTFETSGANISITFTPYEYEVQ